MADYAVSDAAVVAAVVVSHAASVGWLRWNVGFGYSSLSSAAVVPVRPVCRDPSERANVECINI